MTVMVATLHSETVMARHMNSLLKVSGREDVEIRSYLSSVYVCQARNDMVRDFLVSDHSHLWLVESDNTFDSATLDLLLGADKSIVGAHYCNVLTERVTGGAPMLVPHAYLLIDGRLHAMALTSGEVTQVGITGLGCLLVRREVFEHPGWPTDFPWRWFRTEGMVVDGKPVGEDIYFCLHANNLGFGVWVHAGAISGHVKTFIARP